MKSWDFSGCALSVSVVAAMLAGCGGSQPQLAPAGSAQPAYRVPSYEGVLLASAVLPKHAMHPHVQLVMAPDLRRFAPRLWYIADLNSSALNAYALPGLRLVYAIMGAGLDQGACATTGRKTFWVSNSGFDEVQEYDYRGTSPIKTLTESVGEPAGCSIDPTTGDLAVSILFTPDVLVWTNATGTYTELTDPLLETYFVGYDGSGDLFADGFNDASAVGLVELKKGSSTWKSLSLPATIGFPGGVQWDGTYIAVEDQSVDANKIYQLTCSGTSCTEDGSTPLTGSEDCDQGWIDKGIFACGDVGDDEGKLWHYPAGGEPYAHIGGVSGPSVIVK